MKENKAIFDLHLFLVEINIFCTEDILYLNIFKQFYTVYSKNIIYIWVTYNVHQLVFGMAFETVGLNIRACFTIIIKLK